MRPRSDSISSLGRVRLEGRALHAGEPSVVTLAAAAGPIVLEQNGRAARLDALSVVRCEHGVTVSDLAGLSVDVVEHLFAALAGLGVRQGLRVEVEGSELPLLDGGAQTYVDALLSLGLGSLEASATTHATIVVRNAAEYSFGASRYEFVPGDSVEVEAEIRFEHPAVGVGIASWKGAAADFALHIAPARTFGFVRDAPIWRERGRARGPLGGYADVEGAVLLFGDTSPIESTRPFSPNEPARHKLLDLIGDLYVYGGPAIGTVRALRPSHTATHRALRAALDQGIVVQRCAEPS